MTAVIVATTVVRKANDIGRISTTSPSHVFRFASRTSARNSALCSEEATITLSVVDLDKLSYPKSGMVESIVFSQN
jgi:hypothetical protein